MVMKRKKMVVILTALCVVLAGLTWDSVVTQRRNAEDETRLQQVKIGMTEGDVAKLMRSMPFSDPGDAHRKYVFVWQRTRLVDLAWNQPTFGKTITLVDGQVSDVRESIIH